MRALTLIVMILAALPVAAQEVPPLGERVEVNAVLIDAVVTDSKGNQILGLNPDDFVLTENGAPQAVDSVDYFTTRRLLTGPEEQAPFKVEQVHEERYLIFFLDKPTEGGLFDKLAQVRRAVMEFIKGDMGKKDLVAIVGHDVRLKIYSDFTSDKKQLERALEDSIHFSKGVTKPASPEGTPSILRNVDFNRVMDRTGRVYDAIRVLADAVRPIRARKNLVLFSAGIHEPGEEVRGGMLFNSSRYYQPMIEALQSANVSVYAANLMLEDAPVDPVFHQTLERIAQETNGEYFRQIVTFRPLIKQVEKASGGYYLLTYRPQKRPARGFQKVAVAIRNHPELRVKARPGYLYGN